MNRLIPAPVLALALVSPLAASGTTRHGATDQACVESRSSSGPPIAAPVQSGSSNVTGCIAGNARDNTGYPYETGADFVPLTTDDSLGFYVVYSARTLNGNTPNNNVGMFLFELDGGEVLLFGAGYGDHSVALYDAAHDAANVDSVLRGCMGRVPSSTPIRFISPHWHADHINVDLIHALENLGWSIVEILYHEADDYYVRSYYNWRPQDEAKFTVLPDGACNEEIIGYPSPPGRVWFIARRGHTPGAIDAVIDVRNNPRDRFVVLGSQAGGACPDPPPGTRAVITAHGNVSLHSVACVVPYGCGVNPDGSLVVLSGTPKVGGQVVLGVDDPPGDVAPGAIPYLWSSSCPDPLIPCGPLLDMPGMASPYEVLLSTIPGDLVTPPDTGAPWAGPGHPCHFGIPIPSEPALVGISFYYQGGLIDSSGGWGQRIVLTTAVEFRIGA